MKLQDIKDTSDLRDMTMNDVIDVLDELRGVARQRGTEWLARGKVQARKAIGAPDEGAVAVAFIVGILIGAATAAIATMLLSPMPAPEARRRLTEQVDRVRERVPAFQGDGEVEYERVEPAGETGAPTEPAPGPVI